MGTAVTTPEEVLQEAARRSAAGEAYVLATVVRVERPASTRRGDRALVTADGAVYGWIGGACSEPIVVREALRALQQGDARLVRIGPPGSDVPVPEGVVLAQSSCASEGTVEVLLEPGRPRPLLAVVGESPAARTLAELARTIGWRVVTTVERGADAVVVATMGRGDEEALAAALAQGVGYVGLVASARRAGVVLAALRERGLGEESLARVRSPAGLDLGPSSQEEIAVAVLAELVAWRHASPRVETLLAEAADPVCGMTVPIEGAVETAVHAGETYYFCNPHCRARFEADPARYAGAAAPPP
ncbi:MAG TPA: XdhC family protein [Gaiellaceae bacterium]|nr:XdhC family protein [Gaiellaceae bacterium]